MSGAIAPVRVWDLPTRLFHWLLVGLIAFSWGSAEWHQLELHRLSGLAVLGLIVFRLIWGFIGGSTARFANFVRSPGKALAYLRPDPQARHLPGHNPAGGYSVLLMLALIAAQVVTGLFAVDVDGLESGYLAHLVSFDQGRAAAEVHEIVFTLLQIVVVLHLAAVAFYLFARKRNLVRPMVTGIDEGLDSAAGALVPAPVWRFLLAAAIAAGLAWWTSQGLGT